MRLSALLESAGLGAALPTDPEIAGVTHDSRAVEPGFAFVAVRGVPLPTRPPLDGHDYIPAALERGAAAVVGTRSGLELPVPYLAVADDRAALADLAAAFWGHPGRRLALVGVTGSKGKTTTTTLAHHLLEEAGVAAGRVATVGARWNGQERHLPGHFTTPEAPQVQELLAEFVAAGCTHAVLEVSSHALALERVRGLEYEVGVWTNLEPEHLDFHGDLATYASEKRKLLERSRFGVLNRADSLYPQLGGLEHWSYGPGGDWQARNVREGPGGLEFGVLSPLGTFEAGVPMIGAFNAENALAAMAVGARLGLGVGELGEGLASFPGAPGRMQILQAEPFRVVNDFAHTEASLRAALATLRGSTPGRLVVVVGAAGERDPGRRAALGRAAGELADLAVFTEEDHRTESLETILEAMAAAARAAGGAHRLEPDRREAIRWAVRDAKAGDTVLLVGKGHERTLERGTTALPWDEAAEARAALGEIGLG